MAVLELWTVQFAVKRLWIDLPVQLVIIERSSSSLDGPHWLSKDLSPHCHLCACVCVKAEEEEAGCVCAWEQSLLQLMNHRLVSALILHISHPYGGESIAPLPKEMHWLVLGPLSLGWGQENLEVSSSPRGLPQISLSCACSKAKISKRVVLLMGRVCSLSLTFQRQVQWFISAETSEGEVGRMRCNGKVSRGAKRSHGDVI